MDLHQDRYENVTQVQLLENGYYSDENIDTFRVNMMNCIMNIVKLFHPVNQYLYIPGNHGCEDNVKFWIETRKEVASKKISIEDIWQTMVDKCDSSKKKLPKNVGSEVSMEQSCTSNNFIN